MKCYKCGENGLCPTPVYDESVVDCEDGVMSCLHGFVKDSNGTRFLAKDCLKQQKNLQMFGCLRIKNEVDGQTFDDHACYCDTDECNKDMCDPHDCSCQYADPDMCFHPPPDPESMKILS